MQRIHVIDSHTEGEPTRVVVAGGPDLGPGSAAQRCKVFAEQFDDWRAALVTEPRASEAWVGAILLEPEQSDAVTQVVFFNNAGFLKMCVHGSIGVAKTLLYLKRIGVGVHRMETPVGDVWLHVDENGIAVQNVASYRAESEIVVTTQRHGEVVGDLAWGGNWFFLVNGQGPEIQIQNLEALHAFCMDVRRSLWRAGIRDGDDSEIDHVEVFGPPSRADADSRNFVLCPGGAYDRSPCGTGTSAKLACLAADGALAPGQPWRQESVIGSRFVGSYKSIENDPRGAVLPTIRGGAWITGDNQILLDPEDPFCWGIR